MIKVLKNWAEVGAAIGYLTSLGTDKSNRSYHTNPVKNWDLAQIAKLVIKKNRAIKILDMGYGGSNVLNFLLKNGFQNIYGIDLNIPFWDRWQQLMYFKSHFRLPYHLSRQSVSQTNFPDEFFDLLICLSVIEHQVDLQKFMAECARLLKKNGQLYLSTDYWEEKINTDDAPVNYGTEAGEEWNIFSRKEIINLIDIAEKNNLYLKNKTFPKVKDKVVNWNTKSYTFISLVFSKSPQ